MNALVETLATFIIAKARDASAGRIGTNLESRFIFHGPPLEILQLVYEALAKDGGLLVEQVGDTRMILPVLLQFPAGEVPVANPPVGESGRCDETHLLHLRNDPHCPRFVALVPPGQHNNRSVSSTTDEFGVRALCNASHSSFDEWWNDSFVQQLVGQAIEATGLASEEREDARRMLEYGAAAVDEVDDGGIRQRAWRLLSRVFSIPSANTGLPAAQAIAMACGLPSTFSGIGIASKLRIEALSKVADALSDGFGTGIDRIRPEARPDVDGALSAFLAHVRTRCEVPTMFERATPAFYLPDDAAVIGHAPGWWAMLTTELWSELLTDEPDEVGDLTIECTNSLLPLRRGVPAVVRSEVLLRISTGVGQGAGQVQVQLDRSSGSSRTRQSHLVSVAGSQDYPDPLIPPHKTPVTFKASAMGCRPATAKVISLASWNPGILVCCRISTKLSPPKKPARRAHGGPDWETSLTLPGSGRYELSILVSPGIRVVGAAGLADESSEIDGIQDPLLLQPLATDEYLLEVSAEAKYQIDIVFERPGGSGPEICRAYVICEEASEVGCRSEFERLIKLNRRHLDMLDTKAVVQLDRHARTSSLQTWLLEERQVERSFRPLVLADDYASQWSPPNWDTPGGPILSQGRFLHDPRPDPALFVAPARFIEARRLIAARVRDTDEQSGLLESAPLGKWLSRDPEFKALVESYLDAYMSWHASEPEIACWVDVTAVTSLEPDGRTLSRVPEALLLSPLHPLRLAWHCIAQNVLYEEVEGNDPHPCPAACVLDPDCVPDLLTMSLQGPGGVEEVDFLSVECSSDYWSVLWNGARLRQLVERCQRAPFDDTFGITVGGISSGFSSAQVARALEDISNLLAAKPTVSLVVTSAGGATDACNEGLGRWCANRFGPVERNGQRQGVGPRLLEVFDIRPASSRPDDATIANLAEDTSNAVRWFYEQPAGSKPDLGIIAQLDSAEPQSATVAMRSPLSLGGLIRHRVRRQLPNAFLSESRQGLQMPPSGDVLIDKVAACMVALENRRDEKIGLQFAPNVYAVRDILEDKKADFVAVSSAAIDPACFLGGWIDGAYLWDYDLPAYSNRAGDTSGYYLLSQVKDADRDGLHRVLSRLPGCDSIENPKVEEILLEVARRGIPTVRGISGDDTGATGDLGLFLAVRLLQDQFRSSGNATSLLPVLSSSPESVTIALVVPVDPFRGYLSDLAQSVGKDRKEASLSRPDLLVVGIAIDESSVRIRLTPVEVKCRQGSLMGLGELADALAQARTLSALFVSLEERARHSTAWRLALQHLLLSMVGFGLRVYSQHKSVVGEAVRWAKYHEQIAAAVLSPGTIVDIDPTGRVIVADASPDSDARDCDGDGFAETIVIAGTDAGRIVAGDAQVFYDAVRKKVNDWALLPAPIDATNRGPGEGPDGPDPDASDPLAPPREPTSSPADLQPAQAAMPAPRAAGVAPRPDVALERTEQEPGVVLSVGRTINGFEPRPITLNVSDTRLNQLNIGVVGDLGTGKTQLLKSLIFQITASQEQNRGTKPRFLIFDYKRDYSSPEFVQATGATVIKPSRLPLNLFDTSSLGESSAPWLDRFRFFADVLDKVYSGIGPVQRNTLKSAVRNAYDVCQAQGRMPTIYDVHAEYRELLGTKSDSPMAIIDDLVDMEVFAREAKDTVPFDDFFDGVVVISLDAMGQDDRSKNLLVAVMLNMFYENMLKTPKRPFVGSAPQLRVIDSYLLVDEADNIMRYEFDVLRKLLLQGREFGAGVILASQYLRHFKVGATDYREPLLTWFIHKVPNVTPSELSALGLTADLGELAERVKTLPNHQCLYKSFDVAGNVVRGLPFYELAAERVKPTDSR